MERKYWKIHYFCFDIIIGSFTPAPVVYVVRLYCIFIFRKYQGRKAVLCDGENNNTFECVQIQTFKMVKKKRKAIHPKKSVTELFKLNSVWVLLIHDSMVFRRANISFEEKLQKRNIATNSGNWSPLVAFRIEQSRNIMWGQRRDETTNNKNNVSAAEMYLFLFYLVVGLCWFGFRAFLFFIRGIFLVFCIRVDLF